MIASLLTTNGRIRNLDLAAIRVLLLRLFTLATTWVVLFALDAARARAAEAPERPRLLYRQIFVPADQIDAWPRDGEKYLPIEASDFDAWLNKANAATPAPAAASIQEARYSARLEGNRLVECRGRWRIVLRGDRPSFLPLSRMSLDVREAHWHDAPEQAARLGTWGRSGEAPAAPGLEIPRTGTLEFAWQAPTKAIHHGVEIAWQIPAATSSLLILDLPEGKVPAVEGGVVLARHALPPDNATAVEKLQRWEIALNPAAETRLRLVEADDPTSAAAPAVTLREDIKYRVTQRGLDTYVTWHLDDSVHDRQVLAVPLPESVHLLTVAVNGRETSWSVAKAERAAAVVAVVEIPAEPSTRPLQVSVRAWQPLRLNAHWRLPKLRPNDVYWQSGTIELSIGPHLELLALSHLDCRQTGVELSEDQATEPDQMRLAMYSPEAELNVIIANRRPQATIRLGSSLELTDPDVSGRLVTEWEVTEGNLHKLSGELAPGWVVEAVETVPAEALGEWFIDRRAGRDNVELQLARAVQPGRNVSVAITARLQRASIDQSISLETLRMVNWADGRVAQHLLTFQTVEPYAVETSRDLPILASDEVGEEDAALVQQPFGNEPIFDLAGAAEDATLRLTIERGRYEADIRLDAAYIGQQLSHNCYLTIEPGNNGVDRVLIYATAALGDDTRWVETSSNRPLTAARLEADDPRRAALPAAGEVWLLRLPGPTTRTVEISAQIVSPLRGRTELPLLALPEAAKQDGHVLVRAAMDSVPQVEPRGLESMSWPAAVADAARSEGRPPVRTAYRYAPANCLTTAGAAQIWLAPVTAGETNPLVARHVELESFFAANGRAMHSATYELENDGAERFALRLPAQAVMRAVVLNGRPLEQTVGVRGAPLSALPLPAATREATVSVYYESHEPPLLAGGRLQPPLVHDALPILAGRWTVWLPEEFAIADAPLLSAGGDLNWRERFFGPFGRPLKDAPFHPLRPRDWNRFLSRLGSAPIERSDADSEHAGWTAYRSTFIGNGPQAVAIAHPPAMMGWATMVFLLCLIAGRWLRTKSGNLYVALLAVAAAVALLMPAVFASLATGAVLGLLLSLVSGRPRQEPQENMLASSWSRYSTVSVQSLAIALVLTSLLLAEPANNVESPPTAPQATVERVFIPVDSEGRRNGSKYFVSEKFLRELLPPISEETLDGRQWVLLDALYAGELRERSEPSGVVAADWTLAFDIEVLARDTTVVLPLLQEEATWRGTAMLDGVPLPLVWRDGGRGCAIEIREPGRYRLTLFCVPRTLTGSRQNSVKLSIPPLSGARLQLETPKNMPGITVLGKQVTAPTATSPAPLEHELPTTDRLEVQWTPFSWVAEGTPSFGVTGMRWLQIGADEVQLRMKYIIEAGTQQPDALLIAFDPRWEFQHQDSSITQPDLHEEPGGQRSIRVPLPPNGSDRREVTLQWRMANENTFGRLRLPPVELLSIPVTHRWLAVSADPSLEFEVIDGAASPGTANEFLAMWGGAEEAPQLVLGNFRTSVPWSVAIKPRQRESVIDEVLHVAAERDNLRVAYDAEVEPGVPHEYQFPLLIPSDLSIDGITLTAAGRKIPVRWARVGTRRLNVFFSESMQSEFRLELRGSAPAEIDRPRALPRITAEAMDLASQPVQLYRDEGVLVELSGLSAADEFPADSRELPPTAWTARPAGIYRLDKLGFAQARLSIKTNDVQVAGPTLLSLNRDDDGWSAGFYGRLTVTAGQLDTLRLHGPTNWVGPFSVDSDVPAAMEFDPASARGPTLVLHFTESITKATTVEIDVRGLIAPAAQPSVSVPEIKSQPIVDGRRYLVVPAELDGNHIDWSQVGVRPASLPPQVREAKAIMKGARGFEIVDSPIRVAIERAAAVQQPALVRLADTLVWTAATGARLLRTRLVVSATDLQHCVVKLPPSQELVSVGLDGHTAITRAVHAGDWQVSLGPSRLPRVLEIVSIEPAGSGEPAKVQRPSLLADGKPIPVEVSLWTIGHDARVVRPRIGEAASVSKIDQAILRLARLVSIAESATPAAVALPAPDSDHWLRSWATWLSSLRKDAGDNSIAAVEPRSLAQISRPAEEQLTQVAERLEMWIEQCNELLDRPIISDEVSRSPQPPVMVNQFEPSHWGSGSTGALRQPSRSHWTYGVAEGGADEVALDSAPSDVAAPQSRFAAAAAVICAAAAGMWLMRRPAAADFLYRWPHAIAFLLGLAYWAWLWPSWLGLIIATGSLIFVWRVGWPGRSLPLERSTVVRVAPSEIAAP
jgi:hypothetical protein